MRYTVLFFLLIPGVLHSENPAPPTSLGDPVLDYLTQSLEEQTAPGSSVPRNPDRNASDGEKTVDKNSTFAEEKEAEPESQTLQAEPVHYPSHLYLSLKEAPAEKIPTVDPRLYLSLKKIVLPLPQDYAKTYLKLKTLLNPVRKYVQVHIDKSRQRMWVYLDNDYVGDWKISTARRGYWTPVGVYRPYVLERMHYSKKYHHSPMPWSVFFKGGYAIHGTYAVRQLGRPASHGCVRVHPQNAKKLYQLIKEYGKQQTRIIIDG